MDDETQGTAPDVGPEHGDTPRAGLAPDSERAGVPDGGEEPAAPAQPGEPARPGEPGGGAEGEGRARHRAKGGGSFFKELPILIVIALVLALLIKTFLIQAFFIPSGSMEQTLLIGDRVLVNKLAYRFSPVHRGDIIVFVGPPSWAPEVQITEPTNPVVRFFRDIGSALGFAAPNEKDFIKRVIGVPGDTVACCNAKGQVTVNGHGLTEPYVYQNNFQPFGPIKVPPGRLWVMGDHRGLSADSRAHIDDAHHGTIPIANVIGRAFVIIWPPGQFRGLGSPATFHQPGLVAAWGPATVPYALGAAGTLPLGLLRRRRRRRAGRAGVARRRPPARR